MNVDVTEGCATTLDAAEGAPEEVLLNKAVRDGTAAGDDCGMETKSQAFGNSNADNECDRENKRARMEER